MMGKLKEEVSILHILIVEKQTIIGLHLSRCLEKNEFNVFVVKNIKKDKSVIKTFAADYLIIDDQSLFSIGNELIEIKNDMKIIGLLDVESALEAVEKFNLVKRFYKPFSSEDIVAYLLKEKITRA